MIIECSTESHVATTGHAEVPKQLTVRTEDIVRGNLWKIFPAINVDKVADIPCDYPGPMGVPITFMSKYSPEKFEIIGMLSHGSLGPERPALYRRILIRNLNPVLPEQINLVEFLGRMGILIDMEFIQQDYTPEGMYPVYRKCKTDYRTNGIVDGHRISRNK